MALALHSIEIKLRGWLQEKKRKSMQYAKKDARFKL